MPKMPLRAVGPTGRRLKCLKQWKAKYKMKSLITKTRRHENTKEEGVIWDNR
jgi:hypothetical protein